MENNMLKEIQDQRFASNSLVSCEDAPEELQAKKSSIQARPRDMRSSDLVPPFHADNIIFGPQPSTLQILKMVATSDGMAPVELLNVARSIGDLNLVPQFIEDLRCSFTTHKEVKWLEELLSAENFAAFQGTGSNGTSLQKCHSFAWPTPLRSHGPTLRNSGYFEDGLSVSMIDHNKTKGSRDSSKIKNEYYDVKGLPDIQDLRGSSYVWAVEPEVISSKDPKCEQRIYRSHLVSSLAGPIFKQFMLLPPELRERIYEFALHTGQSIQPHLCDRQIKGLVKFHDDNQHSRMHPNHCAMNRLLGVTLVSKQIRNEALPCFYSANTIAVVDDTATYFAHLQHLGRFHMVRHVRFAITMFEEMKGAQTLRQLGTYLKTAEAYEAGKTRGEKYQMDVVKHPRYIAGGHTEMNTFICLLMLASPYPHHGYTTKFTLPVPSANIFTEYTRLRWFPAVCHGLGTHLRFLDGHELSYNHDGIIGITWHRQYQKMEAGNKDDVDVRERALEMYPDLENMAHWKRYAYMRTSCDGARHEWFDIHH
jgi:hypothetical protein